MAILAASGFSPVFYDAAKSVVLSFPGRDLG